MKKQKINIQTIQQKNIFARSKGFLKVKSESLILFQEMIKDIMLGILVDGDFEPLWCSTRQVIHTYFRVSSFAYFNPKKYSFRPKQVVQFFSLLSADIILFKSILKVALSQKIQENFYFSKKIFQISILSRKFEQAVFCYGWEIQIFC